MRPGRLALAITIGLGLQAGAAAARDWTRPQSGDAATRNFENAPGSAASRARGRASRRDAGAVVPDPAAPASSAKPSGAAPMSDEEVGARARRRAVARQDAWDRKMKAVSGSICSGC